MARPKKPAIGGQKWAQKELKIAEKRLRDVRRLLENADEERLPALLRLEAALRREVERLARAAEPETGFFGASLENLENIVLGEDDDD